jgi:hypothetical protein
MLGEMPEKKPFGRNEPPPNYPRDPGLYADPQNWMYPLDKPIRAKLARRYFDELSNRSKYTEQERLFIDSRIDEALKRYGIESDVTSTAARVVKRKTLPRLRADQVSKLGTEELLQRFLGTARLERAKSIADDLVSLSQLEDDRISGKVKQYSVEIDIKHKVITHDCDDWKRNMRSKLMCKHLGKAFLTLERQKSAAILRQILLEKSSWTFNAP